MLRSRIPKYAMAAGSLALATKLSCSDSSSNKKSVVVVGGGSAGLGISAMLTREGLNVTMIEPSPYHYYQPLWTLVSGGIKDISESRKPLTELVAPGVNLVQSKVTNINPEANTVELSNGQSQKYDYLVICPGIQIDWDAIPGVADALANPDSGVASIYSYEGAERAHQMIENFKGGKCHFTFPSTPVKCAGAPQKVMWLFEEKMRDKGLRDKCTFNYHTPGDVIFGVKRYAEMLMKLKEERHIDLSTKSLLVSVDGPKKQATFKNTATGELEVVPYDFLHVTPNMSAPQFLKDLAANGSKLVTPAGFVDVNKFTLQNPTYPNVFSLGDASSSPNAKTAAAIISQAPVVVHNLTQQMKGQPINGVYDGYGSCPLVVGKKEVILAEFGYDGKILESFTPEFGAPFPRSLVQGPENALARRFFAFLKMEFFPYVYWKFWTQGKWYGANTFFKPDVTKPTHHQAPEKK